MNPDLFGEDVEPVRKPNALDDLNGRLHIIGRCIWTDVNQAHAYRALLPGQAVRRVSRPEKWDWVLGLCRVCKMGDGFTMIFNEGIAQRSNAAWCEEVAKRWDDYFAKVIEITQEKRRYWEKRLPSTDCSVCGGSGILNEDGKDLFCLCGAASRMTGRAAQCITSIDAKLAWLNEKRKQGAFAHDHD